MFSVLFPPIVYMTCIPVLEKYRFFVSKNEYMSKTHNLALAMYSFIAFCGFVLHWKQYGLSMPCTVPSQKLPYWLTTSWYWSKIWEWGDTFLLISRRKEISNLHFYHHMFTASIVGLQTYGRVLHTPLYEIASIMNSFVHLFMYLYYAYPIFSMRKYITRIQILQHIIMVIALSYTLTQHSCDTDITGNVFPFVCYIFFLVEFTKIRWRLKSE